MSNSTTPATDMVVVSHRTTFVSELSKILNQGDGIRLISVKLAPDPKALETCLRAMDERPTQILMVDAVEASAEALLLVQEFCDQRPQEKVFVVGPTTDPELILRAHRAGATEFLPAPVDRRHLLDAVKRAWKRMNPDVEHMSGRRGRILSFLGTKGGCGTTTVATNLAVTLSSQGVSTVLIDLDFTSSDVALLLNISPSFTVSDVLQNVHRLDRDLLSGMIYTHESGLSILAAGETPGQMEEGEIQSIAQLLNFLREQFDCVVVNARDTWDPVSQVIATHSDLIHLVSSLDLLSVRRAQWALRRMADNGIVNEVIRFVVNRFDRNPYITVDEVESILELKVAWTIPRDQNVVLGALNDGVPFVSQNKNGLRTCFDEYARVVASGSVSKPQTPRRRGLFGWLGAKGARNIKTTAEGKAIA